MHNADFALSPEQLQRLNDYVQQHYQQSLQRGEMEQFPQVQVRFVFTAVLGRAVSVQYGHQPALQLQVCTEAVVQD